VAAAGAGAGPQLEWVGLASLRRYAQWHARAIEENLAAGQARHPYLIW